MVPLPDALRSASLMPNLDQILIGDLILISPFSAKANQVAISTHQSKRYGDEHSMWTHVAIYVGNSEVCEATTKGVLANSFFDLFAGNIVRVRRPIFSDEKTRFILAIAAMRNLNKKYFWKDIWGFASDHVRGGLVRFGAKPSEQSLDGAFTCSGLFFESYFLATGETPLNSNLHRVCPADFSASSKLIDVGVEWVKLEQSSLS